MPFAGKMLAESLVSPAERENSNHRLTAMGANANTFSGHKRLVAMVAGVICTSVTLSVLVVRMFLSQDTAEYGSAPGETKPCVSHTINGQNMTHQISIEDFQELPAFQNHGGLQIVSGSRTVDILRYSRPFPLCTVFTDAANYRHKVCINGDTCQYSTAVPVQWDIQWYGEVFDRTGFDALVSVVNIEFSYKKPVFLHTTHGIRVRCTGYGAGDAKIVGQSKALDKIYRMHPDFHYHGR